MSQQKSRDVLFMDVHGVLLSAATLKRPRVPLIGKHRHQKWSDLVGRVLLDAGALPLQLKPALLEPQPLWTLRMQLELTTPRTRRGQVIRERKFHERVNLRLLKDVAPSFMASLDRAQQKRLARQVKKLRQDTARYRYFLESEMRVLVQELAGPWMLYLTTAGIEAEVAAELCSEKLTLDLFAKVFLTEKVGLPKSHPDFWLKIARKVGVAPRQCVVVEDNLAMGLYAVRAGMSVVFYDRGYGLEEFIRHELAGVVAGVSLSLVDASLPSRRPFVVCARDIREIRFCLQQAKISRVGGP